MGYQKTLDQKSISVMEVSHLIGTLSLAALAVLLAPLKYRYLQKQQIDELRTFPSYAKQIVLSSQRRAEIQWWAHIL